MKINYKPRKGITMWKKARLWLVFILADYFLLGIFAVTVNYIDRGDPTIWEYDSIDVVPGEDYIQADGFTSHRLKLRRDGKYHYIYSGCVGVYDDYVGTYTVTDNVINCSSPTKELKSSSPPEKLQKITWGDRIYLVPTDRMLDFCNAINLGDQPQHDSWGGFFIRLHDWSKYVSGPPNLPHEWESYLIKTPITATIIARDKFNRAILNVGEIHGIKSGMQFVRDKQDPYYSTVTFEVLSVEAKRCLAYAKHGQTGFLVGDQVKTGRVFHG